MLDRVTRTVEALGSSAERWTDTYYDAADRVILLDDPLGIRTRFRYDPLGRQVAVIEAADTEWPRTTFRAFDAADNLRIEGSSQQYDLAYVAAFGALPTLNDTIQTRYDYDALDRQTKVTQAANVSNATLGHARPTHEMRYDAGNRLVQIRGPQIHAPRNFKENSEQLLPAQLWQQITSFAYDKFDNQTQITEGTNLLGPATGIRWQRWSFMRYDGAGNLLIQGTGLAVQGGDYPSHPSLSEYRYDSANRRIQAVEGLAVPSDVDPSYETPLNADARAYLWVYDEAGNVLTEYRGEPLPNPLNNTEATSYSYDALGRRVEMIEAYVPSDLLFQAWQKANTKSLGHTSPVTQYAYDAADNLTRVLDPRKVATDFHYDALGRQTRIVQAANASSEWGWQDGQGNSVSVPALSGNQQPTTLQEYDALGRLTAVRNAVNVWTRFEYDPLGRQIAVVEAANTQWQRTTFRAFDAADNLRIEGRSRQYDLAYLDAFGMLPTLDDTMQTHFDYDALNRRVGMRLLGQWTDTQVVAHLGHARPYITWVYDAAGNVREVRETIGGLLSTTATEKKTTLDYDDLFRQIQVIEAAGTANQRVTKARFDVAGNRIESIDSNGVKSQYSYDRLGRVTQAQQLIRQDANDDNVWLTTAWTYDTAGRTTSQKTTAGLTENSYDRLGRITRTVQDQEQTTFAYDPSGQQIQYTHIQPLGNDTTKKVTSVTAYAFDGAGRKVSMTDPARAKAFYQYDALGRQTEVIDRRNWKVTRQYDELNRLIVEESKNGIPLKNQFSYEVDNQLKTSTTADGMNHAYRYDALGRRISDQAPHGIELTYQYDAGSRLWSVSDSKGAKVISSHDQANRLIGRSFFAHATYEPMAVNWEYQEGADSNSRLDLVATTSYYFYWIH